MRSISYTITGQHAGKTVQQYLKGVQGYSTRVLTALKKTPDGLLQNGEHTRTVDILREGDVLCINLPPTAKRMPLCDIPVPVLYEDDDVLVYNKPADMPCHQSGGHIYGTLSGVYAAHCAETGIVTPFRAVNRLDKDTTGALVAAKNQLAAGKLWKTVSKVYVALLQGGPAADTGTVDLPIERERPFEIKRIIDPDGQEAVTRWHVLARGRDCTLCAFTLLTGRTHQIRVHMSARGWPLLGDALYGGDTAELSRQALHCAAVAFPHVVTGAFTAAEAPFPQDMQHLMQSRGIPAGPEAWDQIRTLLGTQYTQKTGMI